MKQEVLISLIGVLLASLGLTSVEGGLIEGRNNYEAIRNYQSEALEEMEDNEIPRTKRDVLKGMDRDLIRTKRYIGRVPLSYMKKAILPEEMIQPYATTNDEQVYIQPGDESNKQNSARFESHFRDNKDKIQGLYRIPLSTTNKYYFGGPSSSHFTKHKPLLTLNDELESLSDEEIEKLLLLLDGKDELAEGYSSSIRNKQTSLQNCDETDQNQSPVERSRGQNSGSGGHRWTPEQIQAIMDMYIRPRMGMGKRETGKRSPRTYETFEQPMSFDNALYSEGDPVEFLSDKRSKRVGTRDLIAKATALNRFKKETDPAVLASLSQVFNEGKQQSTGGKNLEHAPIMESSPISENNDRPKSKKDIDWSNYLGVDKRSGNNNNEKATARETSTPSSSPRNHNNAGGSTGEIKSHAGGSISSPLAKSKSHFASNGAPTFTSTKGKEAKEAIQKAEKKKENEVNNKEDDKDWILEQFYKNLAMSTNVKRKRESPAGKASNDLDKLEELEKKMAEAGDKIIWDALKYTGSHRDETLSPRELAQVKSNIISKLSTAYSLEKVREAVDELREQLAAMEKKAD